MGSISHLNNSCREYRSYSRGSVRFNLAVEVNIPCLILLGFAGGLLCVIGFWRRKAAEAAGNEELRDRFCRMVVIQFFFRNEPDQNRLQATVSPAMTIATMLISLIRMLRLGPEVSLNGSPTVSPTTVAL